MSSSTPLLTRPHDPDARTSMSQVKDSAAAGNDQSALPWIPPKRCPPRRGSEGGKKLPKPKPGVRNSRSDVTPPAKPVIEASVTQLVASAFRTSPILETSNREVNKSPSVTGASCAGRNSISMGTEVYSDGVEMKSFHPASSSDQTVIVSPPQDIPPPTLEIVSPPQDIPPPTRELVKSSTPVIVPETAVAPAAEIVNKSQRATRKISLDVSKLKKNSVVDKTPLRQSSSAESSKSRKTSVADGQRTKRKSVTDSAKRSALADGHAHRKGLGTDSSYTRAGITPETQRAAEHWRSRTSASKYRGGAKPLHVSFGDMVMDHHAEQKGMSEHKRRHNLHPLARFRSLAITTNNRARSKS